MILPHVPLNEISRAELVLGSEVKNYLPIVWRKYGTNPQLAATCFLLQLLELNEFINQGQCSPEDIPAPGHHRLQGNRAGAGLGGACCL